MNVRCNCKALLILLLLGKTVQKDCLVHVECKTDFLNVAWQSEVFILFRLCGIWETFLSVSMQIVQMQIVMQCILLNWEQMLILQNHSVKNYRSLLLRISFKIYKLGKIWCK